MRGACCERCFLVLPNRYLELGALMTRARLHRLRTKKTYPFLTQLVLQMPQLGWFQPTAPGGYMLAQQQCISEASDHAFSADWLATRVQ